MVELDERLAGLGTALTFPRDDTLVDDVLAEITAPALRWRRALLIAAAVLLGFVAAVTVIPDARHAVARWLGFESLRIEVVDRIPTEVVSAAPAPPDGVRVDALPGRLDDGLYVKLVESGAQITQVDVDGRLGYWITGEPHVLMYRDADGDVREARMVANALVWQDGDVIRRIEGDISLDRALEIATETPPRGELEVGE